MSDTNINLQTQFDKTQFSHTKDLSEEEILKIQKMLKEQKEEFNTLATKVAQTSKELNDKYSNFLHKT
jgi:uncharacterized protein YlxW (UPF0749 family)